jgi:hypothetical protein
MPDGRRESDSMVLRVLAESVLTNSGEPADQPAILQLRFWAYEEHARPERAGRVAHGTTAAPTRPLAQHRSDSSPQHRAGDVQSLRVVKEIG